ncbi:NB-ARC [Podospora conica]|nr:NB-ARC [Schizothecium conicum]
MESSEMKRFFASHWGATIKQCENSLEPDDLKQVRVVTSWDLVQAEVLDSGETGTSVAKSLPYDITRLKPALGHLRQFTQIFHSLHNILRLSRIPQMLKSLSYKAEAFKVYHAVVSQDDLLSMKEACFDIQVQLVGFFTNAVRCIRGGEEEEWGSGALYTRSEEPGSDPWVQLQHRFTAANQDLTETLARVEKLIAVRRSGLDHQGPSGSASAPQPRFRGMVMPSKKTPSRFFNRVNILQKLDQALGGDSNSSSFRAVAIHGLGGVGKSSIAARYIETKYEYHEYDALFWVHGEKTASLKQSFTDIALRLKLDGSKPNLHDDNLVLVQHWLQLTECKWLIVYDNVEDVNTIKPYWPEARHGKAIITTRSHSLAYELATSGLEVTSWDEKYGSEFLLFLLTHSIGHDIQAEVSSATELSRKLSGHALAITHMAGLIRRRSWSIAEFMRIYSKNPKRAHESDLEALWNFTFASLGKDSRTLLGIASFLASDTIPQFLFEFEQDAGLSEDLVFCTEEFSFSEATEPLLEVGFMKRDKDSRVFSCHRMVQTQFRFFLPLEERQKAFDNAVAFVFRAFPKCASNVHSDQLYHHWDQCDRCIQQALSLKDNFKQDPELRKNFRSSTFCELLRECERYLFETNSLKDLQDMCEVSLVAIEILRASDKEKANHLTACTCALQANMYESTGKVDKAIELNLKGHKLRLEEVPLKLRLIAAFEQNLAYNYNTANDHESALAWFEKSKDTAIASSIEEGRGALWPNVTKKNMARCLLYLDQDDKAQDLLNVSINGFRGENPLNWAMLAYAHFVQGLLHRRAKKPEAAKASFMEAQNMWLKGDQTRLHPFYAGCLYKTGVVCLDQGKVDAAVKHLRDSLEITKFHSKVMPVEHARSLLKLSEALRQSQDSDGGEVADLRDDAEVFLLRRNPQADNFTEESSFDVWVPIFWR